jgi:hypothetical protein
MPKFQSSIKPLGFNFFDVSNITIIFDFVKGSLKIFSFFFSTNQSSNFQTADQFQEPIIYPDKI